METRKIKAILKPEDRLHIQGLLLGELKLLFKTLIINVGFFPPLGILLVLFWEKHTHMQL